MGRSTSDRKKISKLRHIHPNLNPGTVRWVLLLTISAIIGLTSCAEKESTRNMIVQGEIITIDFETDQPYTDAHYINVDGYQIPHIAVENDRASYEYSLPATQYAIEIRTESTGDSIDKKEMNNKGSIEVQRRYPLTTDNIAMAVNFVTALDKAASEDSTRYRIVSLPEVHLLAKVRFFRTDSTKITVRFPSDYPAKISESPFSSKN